MLITFSWGALLWRR